MRIGIMGGTFNPIHNGHLLLAEAAREYVSLDQIIFIPCGQPYMKDHTYILDADKRLAMVEMAIQSNPYFTVSDIEIRRKGYTYSYETFELLKNQYPKDQLYFIMGADSLFHLENWKRPEYLLSMCQIIAVVRDQCDLEVLQNKATELNTKFKVKIILVEDFPSVALSSTRIRERLQEKKSIKYLVPDEVQEFLIRQNLYIQESDNIEKKTI